MGQIIVSGNLKGGTGKTTVAVNLACASPCAVEVVRARRRSAGQRERMGA